MKPTLTLALLAAGAAATAGAAHAQRGIAVSGGIGTTGVNAEVQAEITPYIAVRGGYNYLKFSHDDTYDNIDYAGDLKASTWGAFLDLHPFGNGFVVTGGAYLGDKTIDLTAKSSSSYKIGSTTYTSAQVGTLTGEASMSKSSPFVGLGWDSSFQGDGPWGFKLVGGVMYTGSPSVSLTSTGGALSNDPTFKTQLASEETNLKDDIKNYKYFPVLQAGVSYRF